MKLEVLPDIFAICRLGANDPIPDWAFSKSLFSVTRTDDELSIVCKQEDAPQGLKLEKDWRCLKVQGPLDFGLTGILASLASPLATAGISIFALSTFDTDYLLVKDIDLEQASETLKGAGHQISGSQNQPSPNARPTPRIVTSNLVLRLPTLTDIPEILKYFNENESHLSPFDPKKPAGFYTEKFWQERIPKHLDDFRADKNVRLYLFNSRNDREVIGSMEFSQIARGPFQACYLGYGIAAKHQGQGLMYEALSPAINYAFKELNIHRIMANHLPENERSAKLLRRLGFQRECVARSYLRINGEWRDHVLNSLHNPEWRSGQ